MNVVILDHTGSELARGGYSIAEFQAAEHDTNTRLVPAGSDARDRLKAEAADHLKAGDTSSALFAAFMAWLDAAGLQAAREGEEHGAVVTVKLDPAGSVASIVAR